MVNEFSIRARFAAVGSGLNERSRRLFVAAEAKTAGHGGIAATFRATGIARSTIGRGLKDLDDPAGRFGQGSAARKRPTSFDIEETPRCLKTCSSCWSPRRWVIRCGRCGGYRRATRSWRRHCARWGTDRQEQHPQVAGLLQYRRQVNRKTLEGSRNPDRDAQFEHINASVLAMQAADKPVISIDTKKKELVGDYKNAGSDYRPAGCPNKVKVHDFVDTELGKVDPLRGLRYHRQCRMRQCRHRQRYGSVLSQLDPTLAGCHGSRAVSATDQT